VSGENLAHRLLALAAHDHVELCPEGFRVAGRQRAAGHQQVAAVAQMLRKPQAILRHGGHAVDAHDLRPYRQGLAEGVVAVQEGAVEHLHRMSGLLQTGGHVGDAERRKPEPRPVEPPAEEGVDEQDRGHEAFSTLRS
jgi:hypothetical protein